MNTNRLWKIYRVTRGVNQNDLYNKGRRRLLAYFKEKECAKLFIASYEARGTCMWYIE